MADATWFLALQMPNYLIELVIIIIAIANP